MLRGKKILLGITGSIAAYKAAILVRNLTREGAEVKVVMTELAKQFITPLTMATLSKNPILVDFFDPEDGRWNSHVSLGEWADAYLIAPSTANTMGKMAGGIADNLLLTTYLSARCPVFVAPAMDLDMFIHKATQRNIEKLKEDGVLVVEPGSGELASGLVGKGRMAEPDEIVDALRAFFEGPGREGLSVVPGGAVCGLEAGAGSGQAVCDAGSDAGSGSGQAVCSAGADAFQGEIDEKKKSLSGLKVLVTAGPTVEAIDPVRYISNHSTGKMGYAIAAALKGRGAEVVLVSGPVDLLVPEGVELVAVRSAAEMYEASVRLFGEEKGCDAAVLCAAVADYTPARYSPLKIKKQPGDGETMQLQLEKTRDIAAELGRKKGRRVIAGFALETDNERKNAAGKMAAKNMDFIVLNSLQDPGAGFGHDTNVITIMDSHGRVEEHPLMSKGDAAGVIVDKLSGYFAG